MTFNRVWAELEEQRTQATRYVEGRYHGTEGEAAKLIFRIGWDAHGSERFTNPEEAGLAYCAQYWADAKYEEDLAPVKRDFAAGWSARDAWVLAKNVSPTQAA